MLLSSSYLPLTLPFWNTALLSSFLFLFFPRPNGGSMTEEASSQMIQVKESAKTAVWSVGAVGLGIITQTLSQGGGGKKMLVVESSAIVGRLRSSKSQFMVPPPASCFLTSCHLCKKQLSPHEDVYMYRGDQGYCSVDCRDRQIIDDERREMRNSDAWRKSKKLTLPSSQHCRSTRIAGRHQTRALLQELQCRPNRLR